MNADNLIRRSDFAGLAKILAKLWTAARADSYSRISEQVGEEVDPAADTPSRRRFTRMAAQQITAIEETTRARVAAYVDRATNEGMSLDKLAKLIREDPSGAFSRSRATTIARTETAYAYANSSVGGWRDSGRVDKVIIYDGVDDPECAAANGSVWTLDEYEANPIQHPNCTRSAAPWLDD